MYLPKQSENDRVVGGWSTDSGHLARTDGRIDYSSKEEELMIDTDLNDEVGMVVPESTADLNNNK